jgi:hypothetical protein
MLIEVLTDGSLLRETFEAPNNSEAVARVQDVLEGRRAELWCDRAIVCRWNPVMGGSAPMRCFGPGDVPTPRAGKGHRELRTG